MRVKHHEDELSKQVISLPVTKMSIGILLIADK
jgi:hypothetical protein